MIAVTKPARGVAPQAIAIAMLREAPRAPRYSGDRIADEQAPGIIFQGRKELRLHCPALGTENASFNSGRLMSDLGGKRTLAGACKASI